MLRRAAIAVALIACAGGCGARSELIDDPRDRGPFAAAPADAAAPTDAPPVACARVAVTRTVTLEAPGVDGVTPRLVALPNGETGVAYVTGSPLRVVWERVDAALARVTGPVVVGTGASSWAEAVWHRGEVYVAWSSVRGRASALQRISLDGVAQGPARDVPIDNPTALGSAEGGLFWMAFTSRDGNAFEIAHVDPGGRLLHDVVPIPLGRYGSGHGAAARPDGRSHVVTYPREGPRGVRQSYVNAVTVLGGAGPERRLSEDGDFAAYPVRLGDALVIVRQNDEATVLERTAFDTLERLGRASFPPVPRGVAGGAVGGRFVLAHAEGGEFRVDDFGGDLTAFERSSVAMPSRSNGSGLSVATFPSVLVFALTLVDGPRTRPWLARVECLPR